MIITGMDHFQSVCKKKLVEWCQKHRQATPIDLSNVFIVWSCKTLQNYKCLVSTTVSGNGNLVSHNNKKSFYIVDAELKTHVDAIRKFITVNKVDEA